MTTLTQQSTEHDTQASVNADVTHVRVAQIMGRFGGGGAERVTYNLARQLHLMGGESICIGIEGRGDYADLDDSGMPVISLDAKPGSKLSVIGAMMRLRRVIKQRKLNLLHVHGGGGSLAFTLLALLGMRNKPKVVFTFHHRDLVYVEWGWKLYLRLWCLRRCEVIYGDSHEIRDKVAQVQQNAYKARVFANAVPMSDAIENIGAPIPTVVWMARVAPVKDPQALIRAAGALKKEGLGFKIVMAGEARDYEQDFMDETRALIDEHDVADRVAMPGWVHDTFDLMRGAQIGVQTSLSEGLSLTLLEQMMAGLAIVATDVADTSVAIEDGATGLLIPEQNDEALIDALRRVIADVDLRRSLADNARRAAIERFSIDACATRTAAEYRAVIEGRTLA